jgi:hypothetical protein
MLLPDPNRRAKDLQESRFEIAALSLDRLFGETIAIDADVREEALLTDSTRRLEDGDRARRR